MGSDSLSICFVMRSAAYNGGTRVVATYADRLQKLGHHVSAVCTPPPTEGALRRVKDFLRGRPPPKQNKGSFFDDIDVPLHYAENWQSVTSRDLPDGDAVIATWWETAEWLRDLPPQKGTKLYFVQGNEVPIAWAPPGRVEATWGFPMQKIVVAEWLRRLVRDQGGDDTAIVVPNSVDIELFSGPPRSRQSRPTVGFLYGREPIKGCDIVLAALEQVRAQHPNLRALCFGAVLPNEEVPLPAWVEWNHRPSQATIVRLYSECDAWVYGARVDGFGLPLLEAMACRTPIVATRAGAAPELVDDSVGRLVPNTDPENVAHSILEILALPGAEWSAMSEAARERAGSYTWDAATTRFERAIREAVAKRPSSSSRR